MDFCFMIGMIVSLRVMSGMFVVVIAAGDMIVLSLVPRMAMYNLDPARVGGFHRQGI